MIVRAKRAASNLLYGLIAIMMLVLGRNTIMLERQQVATAKIEQTLEDLGTAFVEIDREGKVTTWTASAERMFGFYRDEMVGQTLAPIMTSQMFVRHDAAVPKAFDAGKTGPFDVRCEALNKDGKKIPVSVRVRIEGDRAKALVRRIDVKQLDWRRK